MSTIGTRFVPKFLQHTEHCSSINYCFVLNGRRSLLQSMGDRTISLLRMDTLHSFYEARDTEQEQVMWITERMQEVICEELHLDQLIPVSLLPTSRIEDQPAPKRIVLQVYDASSCRVTGIQNDSPHPQRQLTRLEVLVWETNAPQHELDGHTIHRLKYSGGYKLWMVLDRPFEITTDDKKPWSTLCLTTSKTTFDQLFQESQELEDKIDSAICLGFDLELGSTPSQALENNAFIDRAIGRKHKLFCHVEEVDAKLGNLTNAEDIDPYMKRAPFTELPKVLKWKAAVEASTLRRYLKKP